MEGTFPATPPAIAGPATASRPVEIDIHQLCHTQATELINNGVSIEADAVLGLTARIQRFGGYATDEAALAPEPFDARPPLVRIFAVDLVHGLVRTGRA